MSSRGVERLALGVAFVGALFCAGGSAGDKGLAGHASPRLVADGIISLPATHEGPATFDASTDLYFTRASHDFSTSSVFRVGPETGAQPSKAPFSTSGYDAGAAFSPRGDLVLFTSKRPTGDARFPDDWNLWAAEKGSTAASPLPSPVNSAKSDCCAAFASDGSFLFSSNRLGSWDIFRATPDGPGNWLVRRLEGSINSEHDEWPSHVSADGGMILLSSIRPGGPGGDDIFAATWTDRATDSWDAVRLPSPVNSDAYEDGAVITPDGRTLLWSSWRGRGAGPALGDVYAIGIDAAGLPSAGGVR